MIAPQKKEKEHCKCSFQNDPSSKPSDWCAAFIPIFNQYFKTLKNNQNKKIKILDVGCGIGGFTSFLYEKLLELSIPAEICGVDISNEAMRKAKLNNKNITFKHISPYQSLPFKSNYFDIIICTFVISAISNNDKLKRFFQTIYEVLDKDHGKFIVSFNNPNEYVNTRFAGIQICLHPKTNKEKPDPLDKVIVKFYKGINELKPYFVVNEIWRSTQMVMDQCKHVFGSNCSIKSKELKYIDQYECDVKSLGIHLNHIKMEKQRAPFCAVIVEMHKNNSQ
eukprot:372460_1